MNTTATETPAPKLSHYVRDHGTFCYTQETFDTWFKCPRAQLVKEVCQIYEGTREKGNRPSHWRGYSKTDLAAICADCLRFLD